MKENKLLEEEILNIIKDAGLNNAVFNVNTSNLSSIRTGGNALCYFKADRIMDLKKIIEICIEKKINFMLIGDCTNILFNDGYIKTVLIKLGTDFDYVEFKEDGEIEAGAACNLSKFIIKAAAEGYDFSMLSGIPGTLGGSIAGNSGSRDTGICDFVKKINYIAESNGEIIEKTVSLDKSNFSYRNLDIPDLVALTGVTMSARKDSKNDILKKIGHKIKTRKLNQPVNTRSLGCFFKNAENYPESAGELIEMCHLKGFTYGGARVSEKHANFIENFKNASSGDIFVLSKIINDVVMEKSGIKLEYEVKLVGF
ncbi:MAG: UDP-N-acetylmuramate dehydrogenase [Actinomycetota bacterium]|nr:UDP-N-acetylmuramate dehydrogenase [Actinomycetota bacterium]